MKDRSGHGALQQPAYQAGAFRTKNLPVGRGPPSGPPMHPSSPSKPAPRAEAPQWPSSWWSSDRLDSSSSDRELAAKDSGEAPAGLSNRRRSEQQEEQHKLQRPFAEVESSSGLKSVTSDTNSVPAARPYATEQSLKVAGSPVECFGVACCPAAHVTHAV